MMASNDTMQRTPTAAGLAAWRLAGAADGERWTARLCCRIVPIVRIAKCNESFRGASRPLMIRIRSPQGFDEPGVRERSVPGDECTSHASRGADDQAIERIPDGCQRGKLVQLRQIEGKEPEARACFHGSSQLGKANAHPPQSAENQHFCDHRRRCQRLIAAGFDSLQGLPRQATEFAWRRQHEDAGVSVEDVSTRHGVPVASRVSSRATAER